MSNDLYHTSNLGSGTTDRHMMVTSKFAIEVQHVQVAYFRKVTGLTLTTKYDTINEGGENRHTWLLPVRTSVGEVTLEKGVVFHDKLWEWYAEIFEDGKLVARTVRIHAVENIHSEANIGRGKRVSLPLVVWTLEDALPIKWQGPQFDAMHDDRIIQKLTFICRQLSRQKGESSIQLGDS